jgi:hypothetical protein
MRSSSRTKDASRYEEMIMGLERKDMELGRKGLLEYMEWKEYEKGFVEAAICFALDSYAIQKLPNPPPSRLISYPFN